MSGYRDLVESLLARDYAVAGYGDADPAARHLILRHDLDMSIEAALPIARIEAELGVAASYFVLLRGETYNPWTAAACAGLRQLLDLGHDIGLHLDASLYPGQAEALDRAAEEECRMLETITGAAIETVSFHRPAEALLGRDGEVAG
ncbi:MAG: GNAT family N-acetyltransferase, partial [Rhodospirillaceae bacterium]|nr:GNAT family N-acetyltransferase [Rhodospirillaceae bacterium]